MSILTKEQIDAGFEAAKRIKAGDLPTPEELDSAPYLDMWTVHAIPGNAYYIFLAGQVSGHPTIADGSCTTSPVLHVDESQGWVRTVSRIYRLGKSLKESLEAQAPGMRMQ